MSPQNRAAPDPSPTSLDLASQPTRNRAVLATRIERSKAWLIDIFLIYVPILYLFYFALGSRTAFLASPLIPPLCTVLFGLIQGLFISLGGRSPGMRAYELYLVKNGKRLSLARALLRYVLFIISFGLVFGLVFCLLRRDGLGPWDLLSQSFVVKKLSKTKA